MAKTTRVYGLLDPLIYIPVTSITAIISKFKFVQNFLSMTTDLEVLLFFSPKELPE